MKKTIAFLSDIHIGDGSPTCWYQPAVHEEYLVAALDSVAAHRSAIRELVLLGDIVDTWCYPFDVEPPRFAAIAAKNPHIFGISGALARALDALDGAVTYVPGNHDMDVTEADVAEIRSPGGHHLRYSPSFYTPAGETRVLAMHGHEFTLFNAPDLSTSWAPLPIGHFVTRMVAEYWRSHLPPGQTVSDLKDQGYPNGLNWEHIVAQALLVGDISIADALIDGVAGKLGISESLPIRLRGGAFTNLTQVKQVYRDLFSRWIRENGGGPDGLLIAGKAALSDYNASYMGWFAQREAFRRNAELVVMGHTHASVSRLERSLVNYANSGFMCPSAADIPSKFVSYATVTLDSPPTVQNMQLVRRGGGIAGNPFAAPSTSIVQEPFMDYSCYAQIDNPINGEDLILAETKIGNGHFITLPTEIKRGSRATLWLQDYPSVIPPHGSDAIVAYHGNLGTVALFNFDCPTGAYPNSCSGGSAFQAKSDDGPWLDPGRVPPTGHPLFVRFKVISGAEDGAFTGRCGQDSYATSVAGLQPGQYARLNGATDLSNCIVANNEAKVFSIRLDKASGPEEYRLTVDAAGPEGLFSGSMHLYFTDQSGDRYWLSVFDHTRKSHTLGYNSSAPAIMKLEWSDTLKP